MSEHRVKTYLTRELRNWVGNLCQNQQLSELTGVDIKYRSGGNTWVQISVADPPGSSPRYFTIKITENM